MQLSRACQGIVALIVIILAGCAPATPAAPTPTAGTSLADAEARVRALEAENDSLKRQLATSAPAASAPPADAEARMRALEVENDRLERQLADLQHELELLQAWADQAEAERSAAERLWLTLVGPQKPAASDFAPLAQASGVLFHDANPQPLEMGPAKAALAARVLSRTVLLGEAEPPPEAQRDYSLEFLGLGAPETVIVAGPAAYYRGRVYYQPMLSAGLRSSMNACCG